MGYSVFLLRSTFFLARGEQEAAFSAMRELIAGSGPAGTTAPQLAFTNTEECLCARDLGAFLAACRWLPEYDDHGNITELDFVGEKLGDEDTLFVALAPFVRDDSSVEMAGEDGRIWRWHFLGGAVRVQDGTINYSGTPSRILPRSNHG